MFILKQVQSVPSKDNINETKKHDDQRDDCPLDKDELGLLFYFC